MSKNKEINIDPTQRAITSYFPISREPLRIESKNILTKAENDRLLRLYTSKNRKHVKKIMKFENSDDDVEYVKTETWENTVIPTCSINPCLPQIIDTGVERVHYGSTSKSNSRENICQSSTCEVSPSKRQKMEIISTKQMTITKFKIPEVQKKTSRTFQMTQTFNLQIDNAISKSPTVKNEKLSDVENMNDPFEIKLEENENNSNRIANHISLVDGILEDVLNSNLSMLLFENEINLLETFRRLTVNQKYLGSKLFTHQIKWYNACKFVRDVKLSLSLLEIKQMIVCLRENLIIKSDYSSESTVCLLNQLLVDDVKAIHDALRLKAKQKKKFVLVDNILNYINSQPTLHPTINLDERVRKMIFNKLGDVMQINPLFYKAFYKVHLLYTYTNPEFDIPSGLYLRIYDIKSGRVSHPDFVCQNDVIFENAQVFDEFYKAFSYKSEVLEALNKKGETKYATMFDLSREIVKEFNSILESTNQNVMEDKPSHLKRFTAGHQYASTLWILCNHLGAKYPLEVEKWLVKLLSQKNFYQKKRGMWYSQLSLIYKAHLKEFNKAIETLSRAVKDNNISPVDLADVLYRARTYTTNRRCNNKDLLRELEIWEEQIPRPKSFPSVCITALGNDLAAENQRGHYKYMYSNGDLSYMNVEQIAIRHYIDEKGFTNGIHCEGALMQTIFYILFWDIIYTGGISYTFLCKMQYLPLDFYSEEFYANRKIVIDERLLDIKSNWSLDYLKSYIDKTWCFMSIYKSLFISAYIEDSETLYKIITCIGRKIVSDICRRLVGNFRDYRAGMPDLFVYNEDKCKFVEVKGPGDILSTKQKVWLNYLLSIGADAEVCYVKKVGGAKWRNNNIL